METVPIDPISPARLADLLTRERAEHVGHQTRRARRLLDGRVVWNVNATATGGGVAEMLQALLAYTRGAGVDARWVVLEGSPDFFRLTKRLHNMLHGTTGDGGPVGEAERATYEGALESDTAWLREQLSPGDVVLLHDPQTVGMTAGLREAGAVVVWRCHVGRDTQNEHSEAAWEFLRRYVEQADVTVFSRDVYAPPWVDRERVAVVPPSLDPFSPKNAELSPRQVRAALRVAGLVDLPEEDRPEDRQDGQEDREDPLCFERREGGQGRVRAHDDLVVRGGAVPGHARVVLQVSRWDRLKDMAGVLTGVGEVLEELPEDVHLHRVGPAVTGVGDDPEGAEVLEECTALFDRLPGQAQARVHLTCLPMDDIDENAHLVNALQRHATVMVQKSLVEGFGLTVTEPMWKGRAVLASRVGGIQDQVEDGVSGVLLDDPGDLRAFGRALRELLDDEDRRTRIGTAARERVREQFLGDRHLLQYVDLLEGLLAGR